MGVLLSCVFTAFDCCLSVFYYSAPCGLAGACPVCRLFGLASAKRGTHMKQRQNRGAGRRHRANMLACVVPKPRTRLVMGSSLVVFRTAHHIGAVTQPGCCWFPSLGALAEAEAESEARTEAGARAGAAGIPHPQPR
jgi:hypothetical protein